MIASTKYNIADIHWIASFEVEENSIHSQFVIYWISFDSSLTIGLRNKKKAGRRIWNHDGDEWNKCMIVYVWMREPDGKFDQYIWNGCTRNQEDILFVKIYHLLI